MMAQSLQNQMDICIDFYEGIEIFKRDNMYFDHLLQETFDKFQYTKIDTNVLIKLRQSINIISSDIENNIRLLDLHREDFAMNIILISKRMKRLNLTPKFDNGLDDGLVDSTKNFKKLNAKT